MKRRIFCNLIFSTFLGLPISVGAQGSAYFGPHLGIQKASGSDNANYLVGASVRLRLLPALAAEGSISYRQEDYGNGALTVRNWPVTVTGLLYPLPILYGGVGAGWYHTTLDYDNVNGMLSDNDTKQEFGWHLAAGIELPAWSRMSLTGDVRYIFLDYELDELPEAVVSDTDADFYSVTLGLLFRL